MPFFETIKIELTEPETNSTLCDAKCITSLLIASSATKQPEEVMVPTISLRIDQDLVLQAEREAGIQNRSKAKQLEYWAKLGKAVSTKLDITDALAVSQGIKTIRLEVSPSLQSITVDPDLLFSDLERDRTTGVLADNVTTAKIYYEASVEHPGYLDRVNSGTGERQTGLFEHGEFKVL